MAAVVVAACAAVPAGASIAPGEPASPRPRLLVIGDSIILGTDGHIAADLPGWDVTLDAAVSRSTAAGLDALQAHGTDYSVVVVELGANDGGTPGVFQPRVAALLDALASVPRVVWLTIHQARPYYAETNAIIRSEVAQHPNASVGDWNAAIRPGDVGGDGLHLTPQGSLDMASWVAGVVRRARAPATTTTSSTTTTTTTTVPPAPSSTARVAHRTGAAPEGRVSPERPGKDAPGAAGGGKSGSNWTRWGIPVIAAVVLGGAAWLWYRRSTTS